MNEIMIRKHVKQVMKYGINKNIAYEIVSTALETSKGKNIDTYINYAITLVYGLQIKKAK